MHEYEGMRRVRYDFGGDIGVAVFVPVCQQCFRFVRPGEVRVGDDGLADGPNTECSRCGPTEMVFEGFF